MNLTVIGLGLIGGSIAIDLRKKGLASSIVGIDINPANGKLAVELGLVDKVVELQEGVKNADVIIV
jgi:prephenate dehydrogenase